jgi:hypothetical protein
MSSSSQQLSDDDAQPLDTLIAMTAKVVSEIRASLEDGRCQLIPAESTYPRIYSLAALSHECVFLEELCKLAVSDAPSDLLALLARHHLETWITGVYLVFGGEGAFAKFRGEADRARLAMQNEIKAMQKTGRMADVDSSALDDDSGWEPQKFAYQRIFEEVDSIGEELGLLRNAKAAYAIPYRALSNDLGAHPTFRVIDRYVDMSGTCARVEFSSTTQPFRRRPIQWCLLLTALHAIILLGSLGFPLEEFSYSAVLQQLKPPAGSPLEDDSDG